jgi:hypothetical protein
VDSLWNDDVNSSSTPPTHAARSPDPYFDDPSRVSHMLDSVPVHPRSFLRSFLSIIGLWLTISIPLNYVLYKRVEPMYRAESLLLIDSDESQLFEPSYRTEDSAQSPPVYLENAVVWISSDHVVNAAILNSQIANLPMIRSSEDPKQDLQNRLDVQIIPRTHWIRVALESPDPSEAATIVNAVVDSFKEQYVDYGIASRMSLRRTLEAALGNLQKNLESKREQLLQLACKSYVELFKAAPRARSDQGNQAQAKTSLSSGWPTLVEEVQAGFLTEELRRLADMRDPVRRKLEQLRFTEEKPRFFVALSNRAESAKKPFRNDRLTYMATSSLGVLLILFGAFVGSGLVAGLRRRRLEPGH